MIKEEYKLSSHELEVLAHRLLADDREFEKVWSLYKTKNRRYRGGVDDFKALLQELLT